MGGDLRDAALIDRAARGDDEAFVLLYGRYKRSVWELSYFLCRRNHHDAEDALQETFVKAWHGLRRYRGSGTFKSWLLSICRNVCIDRVHRAPVRPVALESCREHELADRRCDAGAVFDAILLRATLAQLPHDECEAWFVVDVLGCSSHEAARVVGARAASTVRSRVTRAREQIAAALGERSDRVVSPSLPTRLCGLYHSSLEQAIVVAFRERGARSPASRFARIERTSFATAVVERRADAAHATAVDPSCALAWSASEIRDGFDLVGFFDELSGGVAHGTRVVAIVNSPAKTATVRWCDTHPQWELLAHRFWREEAKRLLACCGQRSALPGPGHVRALLDAGEPFAWALNASRGML